MTDFEKRDHFAQNIISCYESVKFTCPIEKCITSCIFNCKHLWNQMRYRSILCNVSYKLIPKTQSAPSCPFSQNFIKSHTNSVMSANFCVFQNTNFQKSTPTQEGFASNLSASSTP